MKQLSLNSMFGHAALTLREQTDLMKTALFKQLLLRSALGHTALAMREQAALVKAALWHPEAIGAISNDRLASLLIAKLCLPGKVFIDIGAHIGSVFSEVHRNDASIKIIAFEAIPQKVSDLRKIFPYAEVHQFAIGESTGEVPFYINVSRSGYSSLSQFSDLETDTIRKIIVPLRKLDDVITSADVDLIKIDVEGAELGVIRGGKKLLSENRPAVIFESTTSDTSIKLGYTKKALWEKFNELNYSIFVPNRLAHNGDSLSLQGFLESHIYPRRTTNYFAIPRERRIEIRDRARQIVHVRAH